MSDVVELYGGRFVPRTPDQVPMPAKLTIEAFGGCNLRCPLCPTGQGLMERPRGPMKMAVFEEIMRQLGDYVKIIDFYNWSEPLLNRQLPQMIRIARERGIHVIISTNLNVVPDAEALMASGFNQFHFSCDAATAETYVIYRVGGDFNKVMQNLHALLRYRHLNPGGEIYWRFITFEHNKHEIPLVLEKCQELGIKPDICPMRVDMRQEILLFEEDKIQKDITWIPTDSPIYDKENGSKKQRWDTCYKPWREVVIDVDGSVMTCCSSYDRHYDMGNIMETPFVEIWNGALYRAAREYILYNTSSSDTRTICHICKDNGYPDY